MTAALPMSPPHGARHSTSLVATAYLSQTGRLMFNPQSRGQVHQVVRQWLRVARTAEERARVMRVWREVHYLGRGQADPIGVRQIRLSYYLDLPALRPAPISWYPAAAVTIRFCLPNGVPRELGLESPLQALEIARNYLADDLRYPAVPDLAPEILREVVRRTREGTDWADLVNGRVKRRPRWLLTFSDPAQGHDGGLYQGAGAVYLGRRAQGKEVWGWALSPEARMEVPTA